MIRWIPILCSLLITAPAAAETMVEHYVAAMAARTEGNFEQYYVEIAAADAILPGHPVVQFHLARACAGLGWNAEAAAWLHRALDQGAWMDLADDSWLEPLHDFPGWARIEARADSVGAHHGPGTPGLELDEYDLMPEGIDYDSVTDRFVLGSTLHRKILLVDRQGVSSEFIASDADGVLSVLGVRVDAERRRLWAVSVRMAHDTGDDAGATRLHCWSLEDGTLLGRWDAPENAERRNGFNDLALRPDGSVVVTDADAGALLGATLGQDEFEQIVGPGGLRGPNGIAISADGGTAYVAEYIYGVAIVDLTTGTIAPLAVPDDIAFIGVDGLYLHEGELVAVQNYAGLDRAAAFRLDDTGRAVDLVRILEAHHPRADDPTTGVIVGDEFWYIANSHIAGFDHSAPPPDFEVWGTVLILRVPL
jgi:hypothetical protein